MASRVMTKKVIWEFKTPDVRWHELFYVQGGPKVTLYSKIPIVKLNLLMTFSIFCVSYSLCGNHIYVLVFFYFNNFKFNLK